MPERFALLLTDVVDSTATNVAVGDAVMGQMWEQHDQSARALMRAYHGIEIGRTDGFLVVFKAVRDAVGFATAYHRTLDGFTVPWRARVAVHVGDVELRKNPPDVVAAGATPFDIDGVALPVVARICALARGRQTLVSATARAELTSASFKIVSHGHWRLKGVVEPIELFEAGDERSDFVPPEDGEKGYRVVLEQETWRPLREIRNSLPAERDPFVGRSRDLRRMAELLESGARLVSVVGTGGMGKTRLVLHFARRWLGEFTGGAWFCDLSEARDRDGIYYAVAQGLDVTLGRADPRTRLADAIAGRNHCLVILDNFEQVATLAEDTLGHWLDRAPNARFIATTRERLGLTGEHVVVLEPMARADAAKLFLRRALVHRPDLRVSGDDEEAIDRLVDLLDGLPLAIELAAGRLPLMSPRAMLARIDHRFALLAARGGRPKRQSTLMAAFDWSWELLTPAEQRVLAQTSVFSGGFTLEAAEHVLGSEDGALSITVFETLASLVDKSFVRVVDDRFALLVSVREYAASKLTALASQTPSVAPAAVEARHGAWFARSVQGGSTRNGSDLENILVAARRAIARNDARSVARLCENAWQILQGRGPVRTIIELVESALAMTSLPHADRVHLVHIHGHSLLVSGDSKRAREQLGLANVAAKSEGLRLDELRALASLAELNLIEGHVPEAKRQYEEAVEGAERLGDAVLLCAALNGLGVYFDHVGHFQPARERFQQALAVARSAGDRRWEGGALSNLGLVEANLGHRAAAKAHYDNAIAVARELGDRVWEGNLLCNLGLFKLEDGDTEEARVNLERSLILAREGGLSLLESVVLCNIGLLNESLEERDMAEAAYRDALRVARLRGDQRSQGQFLGYLGLLVARARDPVEGRDLLLEGIAHLRRVEDRLSLAIALCRYTQGCSLWGDAAGGKALLDEATTIAAEIGVAPGSELSVALKDATRAIEHAVQPG
jgi:predicted ATPase/class 3 adenylate cyclase/Tfp pilus assembly protein PilF